MKKDNKKALYESIMASVAKEVKKALNENYGENYRFSDGEFKFWTSYKGLYHVGFIFDDYEKSLMYIDRYNPKRFTFVGDATNDEKLQKRIVKFITKNLPFMKKYISI